MPVLKTWLIRWRLSGCGGRRRGYWRIQGCFRRGWGIGLSFGFDLGHDTLKYSDAKGNPFKDLRVRQAINMAVDRDAIVRAVMLCGPVEMPL